MALATAALVYAGKSVATPAIAFIVNKAFSHLRDWHRAEGMEAVKVRLEQRLAEIKEVYDIVNHEQIDEEKGHKLDCWLWGFRDAVEGAEDALDEVDYYKLAEDAHQDNPEHQIQVQVNNWGTKVYRRIVKPSKENMAKKLRKAIQDLDEVARDGSTLLQHISCSYGRALPDRAKSSDQQTSSALVATDIFGRDNEKHEVLMWLTSDVDEGPDTRRTIRVPVFAIIGIAGIGKTTLAQLVYRDLEDSPHPHFDIIVWVHVSKSTFSATGITKKILEAVTRKSPNADSLEALQQLLKEKLKPKKFLLILDDVWEDGRREEWERLMAPLQASQSGSRILLTTRMRSVADTITSVMGSKKKYFQLGGLDEEENFKLFQKFAFEDMKAEDYTHLLQTAENIVKKFQGCPLVTKIAGGHLKDNVPNEQYWNNLSDKLEQLKGHLDGIIMTVLQSSYQHLPEDLQLCFRYCSIFPKDCMFKKDELVKMWMGSGLIPEVEGGTERPEDIGESYLAQLTRKSFFSFVPTKDPYGKPYSGYYIMHDLLHDLSRSVSFGECLRLESGDYKSDRHTVRHLWIADFSKLTPKETKAISFFKNLRTLVIESSSDLEIQSVRALERVVKNLKRLRLLILKGVPEFCFAKEVANKHLRYVSFSGMQKAQGLSKLYHLQILIADRGIDIGSEQSEFGSLSQLRYVSHGFGEFFVARLTSLQELHNFQIQAKEGYKISSLQNLSSIRKLTLCNLENIGNHKEVIEARLNEKDHLKSLSLNWSVTNSSRRNEDDMVKVIENLQPPARLENLEIAGYRGRQFPSWIDHQSLTNMVSLKLRDCRNWEYLPALGNLLSLKHLELKGITKLKQIGQSSDGSLPPNLRTLVVVDCTDLGTLPLLPSSLEQLEIDIVGLTTIPSMCDHHDNNMDSEGLQPKKLLSVTISNCSQLTSLKGSFLLLNRCVQTIQILNIVDCTRLEDASLLFKEMNDLTEFRIRNSKDLKMSKDIDGLLPKTLKELSMQQCGGLQLPLLNSLLGLTNLTSLSLCNCSVESLPSSKVFESLTALREMDITDCKDLSSLGGLGALPYLSWLEIKECKKLQLGASSGEVCGNHRLQVYTLSVQNPTMLEIEPLQRLRNVKHLIVSIYCDPISQPWLQKNKTSLESLEILKPVGAELQLQDISSLKKLELDTVRGVLPFPILPSSLESFIIRTCYVIDSCWLIGQGKGTVFPASLT